jgi:hypothetical protein
MVTFPTFDLSETAFDEGEFSQLWLLAATMYGVGDVVTTVALVWFVPRLSEGNLFLGSTVAEFGLTGLIVVKLTVFFVCICASLWAAPEGDWISYYFPPALLSVVGAFATVYNLRLLFG